MKTAAKPMYMPRFVRVIFALMMREMATTYGKSYFGYVWAVLDPIGGIAVLSIAFSLAFAVPALGESFPLFYATGYMPFVVYSTIQKKINGAVRENKTLLFYPRVTYMDAIISRFILNLITQLLVAVVVFTAIMTWYDVPFHMDTARVFNGLMAAAVLGLGIGALNCVIVHLVPSWKHMWGIITRPLFLISCIFYLYDTLPAWAQSILWYNPLVHVIGMTRDGIYGNYDGDYITPLYPYSIGGVTLLLGLMLLRRYSGHMVNN
ncbi:MAG: ABC transporter permease [Pseudomonadota bacterium]